MNISDLDEDELDILLHLAIKVFASLKPVDQLLLWLRFEHSLKWQEIADNYYDWIYVNPGGKYPRSRAQLYYSRYISKVLKAFFKQTGIVLERNTNFTPAISNRCKVISTRFASNGKYFLES